MADDFKEYKRFELGQRAVKAKWFKWMPGMLTLVREGNTWIRGARLTEDSKGKIVPPTGAIPDVEDPATRGCVRYAAGLSGDVEILAMALEGLL